MSAAILVGEPHAMTYLVATDLPDAPAGERFRALLARRGILQLPGAHNGQAALQAKAAGFEALYLSGAAMTASMGLPDLGIITVDEVALFHPAGCARQRTARAGGWRHRLWRSAQRHAHGPRLRGRWLCCSSYRRSVAAQEVRPFKRQETG